MKRALLFLCVLHLATSSSMSGELEARGEVYFDRGHYWIELTIEGIADGHLPQALLDKKSFEIERIGEGVFRPSRVELLDIEGDGAVILLSSGKLKGSSCYSVAVELDTDATIATGTFCDPFHCDPEAGGCSAKRFFRRYIAPAFGRSGDGYSLDQFKYEYELDDEKSQAALTLQPSFETVGWEIELLFDHHATRYESTDGRRSPVDKRSVGLEISRSGWIGWLGSRFSGSFRHERSRVRAAVGDSTLYGQQIRIMSLARLDNLFDSINRHCISVFKGVDMGLGYAWYVSNDEEVWGEGGIDGTAPIVLLRFTWTFLYGLQFSYAFESALQSEHGDGFEAFHTARLRLLLRNLLEREERRPYHPDLECVYERGRRLPFFEREERITIGFTFDLFPW